MKLAVGVTIGPRVNGGTVYDYFAQSLQSIRAAGFDETIHAFLEPGAARHVPEPEKNDVVLHQHDVKHGCFRNFKFGLQWLVNHTDAPWLLMLQDDAVWRQDGHAALMSTISSKKYANVGMLSPYASKAMVPKRFQRSRDERWAEARFHNRAFWGAVAMLFPRASAVALLTRSQRFMQHTHSRKLDVVVGNALRVELGLRIYVHVPSLVEHIGAWSTLGRHRLKSNQWGRRGFLFREQ